MSFGPWELLIILAIVLLIFGPSRLKTLGSDLGKAIKGFRSAVKHEEEDKSAENEPKIIEDDTPPKSRRESRQRERSS